MGQKMAVKIPPGDSKYWKILLYVLVVVAPSGLLLAAAAALSPKLGSLHLHSGLLLAAAAALCPKLVSLHNLFWAALGCRLVSHVTRYVSLRDFPSGLLLAAAAVSQAACLPSLSAFMISLLGCSWLPLPPCLPTFLLVCSWSPLLHI